MTDPAAPAGASKTDDAAVAQQPPGVAADGYRTYYGQPIVKEPEWTWEVPWYLFVGGLGGAASGLAAGAAITGNDRLARSGRLLGLLTSLVGPPLLIADLGRPKRFLNMLRVFKPTSAMSMGSWTLVSYSTAAGLAGALEVTGWFPRLRVLADAGAAVFGFPMATYTGVLMADSAIPVWHEARKELPLVFAGSAAASAGAAATLLTPAEDATPARRLAIKGAFAELAATRAMEERLGEVGEVYEHGDAGAYGKAAKALTAAGGVLVQLGGRKRRWLTRAGCVALLAGSVCLRWSVYRAGFASSRDPKYVVGPQRDRAPVPGSPT
jgi:formate-dependent nitrite reductase membrane component NrfD